MATMAAAKAGGKATFEKKLGIFAPEVRVARNARLSERNRRNWQDSVYRERMAKVGGWGRRRTRDLVKEEMARQARKQDREERRQEQRRMAQQSRQNRKCRICHAVLPPYAQKYCKACREISCRIEKYGSAYEYVNRKAIFARDGWKCQHCGIYTPESVIGQIEDNAPELDHILPLSKGGAHSKPNTQCLCRACNSRKSDSIHKEPKLVGADWNKFRIARMLSNKGSRMPTQGSGWPLVDMLGVQWGIWKVIARSFGKQAGAWWLLEAPCGHRRVARGIDMRYNGGKEAPMSCMHCWAVRLGKPLTWAGACYMAAVLEDAK